MGEKIRSNRSGDSSEEEADVQLKGEVLGEIEKLKKVAHVPDEIIGEKQGQLDKIVTNTQDLYVAQNMFKN